MIDVFLVPVILLVLGIGVFLSYTIITALSTSDAFTNNPTSVQVVANATTAVSMFDYGFLIIAFGFGMAMVAYGWLYPSHPIFIVVGIVMLSLSMITTAAISNVFSHFSTASQMTTTAASFPFIGWLMGDTLPVFMAVFGFLLLIAMYSRLRSGTA